MSQANASSNILASRYANALFELADAQKSLDTVAADLKALKEIDAQSAEFRLMTKHPLLSRSTLEKGVLAVVTTAKLGKLVGDFLTLLARNHRLGLLVPAIDAFLVSLAVRHKEIAVDVRAARALTPEQTKNLTAKLAPLTGKDGSVRLTVTEEAGLLGGLVVQVGSCRVDASVKGKLERLERHLKSPDSSSWLRDGQKGVA